MNRLNHETERSKALASSYDYVRIGRTARVRFVASGARSTSSALGTFTQWRPRLSRLVDPTGCRTLTT
jgi:hypothetical protein